MNKKCIFVFLLAMIAIGRIFAQTSMRYDIIDVEQLRLKADSVAKAHLEMAPDFYGYSAVLHTDKDGRLTTLTYPLDAKFRYSLPVRNRCEGCWNYGNAGCNASEGSADCKIYSWEDTYKGRVYGVGAGHRSFHAVLPKP